MWRTEMEDRPLARVIHDSLKAQTECKTETPHPNPLPLWGEGANRSEEDKLHHKTNVIPSPLTEEG